jgi:hypothetical protein
MTSRGAQSGWVVSALLAVTELACSHSRHRLGTLASDDEPGTEGGTETSAGGAFSGHEANAGAPSAGRDAGTTTVVTTAVACDVPGQRLALRADQPPVPTCQGELGALLDGSGLDVVSRDAPHICDDDAGWGACEGTTSVLLRFDLGANRLVEEVLAWDGSAPGAVPRVQIATLWLASDGGTFFSQGNMRLVADPSTCPRPVTRWTLPAIRVARFIALSLELEAPVDAGARMSLGEVAVFGRACDRSGTEVVVH